MPYSRLTWRSSWPAAHSRDGVENTETELTVRRRNGFQRGPQAGPGHCHCRRRGRGGAVGVAPWCICRLVHLQAGKQLNVARRPADLRFRRAGPRWVAPQETERRSVRREFLPSWLPSRGGDQASPRVRPRDPSPDPGTRHCAAHSQATTSAPISGRLPRPRRDRHRATGNRHRSSRVPRWHAPGRGSGRWRPVRIDP
jgi:hypothetical protein